MDTTVAIRLDKSMADLRAHFQFEQGTQPKEIKGERHVDGFQIEVILGSVSLLGLSLSYCLTMIAGGIRTATLDEIAAAFETTTDYLFGCIMAFKATGLVSTVGDELTGFQVTESKFDLEMIRRVFDAKVQSALPPRGGMPAAQWRIRIAEHRASAEAWFAAGEPTKAQGETPS